LGHEAFGFSDLVMSGFIRIVTNPSIFERPTPTAEAFEFVEGMRHLPNVVGVQPGPRHWELFEIMARSARARGRLIADAYFAALALEVGADWITADRDFARFPDLRWRHPLDG
jgi:uncharacterized protein